MSEIFAGTVDEFDEGVRIILDLDGTREIGVLRVGQQFHAFANRCVHQGGPVCEGIVIGKVENTLDAEMRSTGRRFANDEPHIVCPWHGWEFNLESGKCAADPRMGLSKFPVKVEGNEVYVVVG